jgi:predicted O-methyltransferase YrrM
VTTRAGAALPTERRGDCPVLPIATRIAELARRLVREPRLAAEAAAKLRSRFTLGRHRRRTGELARYRAASAAEALARLLEIERPGIEAALAEPALARRLAELERWLDEPGTERSSGAAYLELLYALVRLTGATRVVETGLAYGFSSTVLLAALEENGAGELWSTDLPAFQPGEVAASGAAVPADLAASPRWHRRDGPDRRVLPGILEEAGSVDLCHYDSDKSYEGMRWTLDRVWARLAPGGVLVLDDAHSNDAFLELAERLGIEPVVVAKPTRTGVYRWAKEFPVGLLRKPPAAPPRAPGAP